MAAGEVFGEGMVEHADAGCRAVLFPLVHGYIGGADERVLRISMFRIKSNADRRPDLNGLRFHVNRLG